LAVPWTPMLWLELPPELVTVSDWSTSPLRPLARPPGRRAFTESADPGMPREHVATMVFYHRWIRALVGFFDCEPEEEILLAARRQKDATQLAGALLRATNVKALLLDTGYPPPEEMLSRADLEDLGGGRTEPMLCLETLMERLGPNMVPSEK
jgi:hypothetical protein